MALPFYFNFEIFWELNVRHNLHSHQWPTDDSPCGVSSRPLHWKRCPLGRLSMTPAKNHAYLWERPQGSVCWENDQPC